MEKFNYPVYPLVPSFLENEEFDIDTSRKYIKYLDENGANVLMTTAGTSQYNLLTLEEIRTFNNIAGTSFSKKKILGLPPLSTKALLKEIELLNKKSYKNTFLMLLFPERYYHNNEIVEWAHSAADISDYPVFLHGMFMRKGTGGQFNYSANLYNDIIKHSNIIGTKEETSDLALAFNVVEGIEKKDFNIIVAGGTLRRFMFLNPAGANTFLSGVGSIFPEIEERFYNAHKQKDIDLCKYIISAYETPLFNAFKTIGWHPSLRESLRIKGLCNYNRKPFAILTNGEKKQIEDIVLKLETKYKSDSLFK